MIYIAGSPFQPSSLESFGSVESSIIRAMLNAPAQYSYSNYRDFLFEINVRTNIIKRAEEMSRGKSEFTVFPYTQANPAYWYLTPQGGMLVRSDVYPSDAIRDIFENSPLYAFECAMSCVIIFYKGLLDNIGDNTFNTFFQNLYLYSWHTDVDLGLNTFYGDHYIPGDVIYFNNPDYSADTPWFRGVNAVSLTGNDVFGHGFGVMSRREMIDSLNEMRNPGSNQTAYLTNLVSRPSFQNFANYSTRNQAYIGYKKQPMCIHHNECSISHRQYLFYLYGM